MMANASNVAALVYHGLPESELDRLLFSERRCAGARPLPGEVGLHADSLGQRGLRHGRGLPRYGARRKRP